MNRFSKAIKFFTPENIIRLLLLVVGAVAFGLSIAVGHIGRRKAVFTVLPVAYATSTVCNALIFLSSLRTFRSKVISKRLRFRDEEKDVKAPSLLFLAADTLGLFTFLALYIWSTIETANAENNYGWYPIMLMTYSGAGALVAR
ncbi:hypothetical protein PV08_05215 [Exophiala spinifera]|uniref:Uncharacterized protein n=1 Tax=Exophiala spinifera TaxID=91928 RepID=A0A0D2B933_9EURO|nr:uncharacterized protein PV08_05215 [Exophiala spinifera]KIW15170.1 hypothetical protein PV08_05215 [Exophiala spinifera]